MITSSIAGTRQSRELEIGRKTLLSEEEKRQALLRRGQSWLKQVDRAIKGANEFEKINSDTGVHDNLVRREGGDI